MQSALVGVSSAYMAEKMTSMDATVPEAKYQKLASEYSKVTSNSLRPIRKRFNLI